MSSPQLGVNWQTLEISPAQTGLATQETRRAGPGASGSFFLGFNIGLEGLTSPRSLTPGCIFSGQILCSLCQEAEHTVHFAHEGLAGAQETRDGAGSAEGEAGETGIVLGVEGNRVGPGGDAGEEHAQDTAQGHTG
jgi:hypothetical protein